MCPHTTIYASSHYYMWAGKLKEKKGFSLKKTGSAGRKEVILSPTGSTDEDALTHIDTKTEKKERERDAAGLKHSKAMAGATLLAVLVQKILAGKKK